MEDADTAQARAEELMYGAEEDLPLHYWRDLAEKEGAKIIYIKKLVFVMKVPVPYLLYIVPVLGIRIRRTRIFSGLPHLLVRGTDPDLDPTLFSQRC